MKKIKAFDPSGCLGPVLRPRLWRIVLLCVLALAQAVLQVGMALIFQYVIDSALAGDGKATLWSALLVADLLLQVGVHGLSMWYTHSTADHFAVVLREKLLDVSPQWEIKTVWGVGYKFEVRNS